jgi:SAM-dependent methyltransferase
MKERIISTSDPVGSHVLQVIARADRFNKWMYREFRSQLGGEVLEIGSGIGNISQLVIDEGFRVSLSDCNEEYCEWLRKKFAGAPNVIDIMRIDLLHENFETVYATMKEKFDCIFLLNVIEHLHDDQRATANCRFMMKPGGRLVILAPAYQWLYSDLDRELKHFRRYSITGVKRLLETNGFSVRNVRHFNFLGLGGWLVFGKIFRRRKLGGGEMGFFNAVVFFAKLLDKLTFRKIGLSIIGTGIKR